MSSKLTGFVLFVIGAVAGSAVTLKLVKDKYERISQEEIDSVKALYSDKEIKTDEEHDADDPNEEKSVADYAKILNESGYHTNYAAIGSDSAEEMKDELDDIFVIPPEEFGELADYYTICLTYYSDGVLADDMDIKVEDIENKIGKDSLSHFGEYDDDSVHVRNNRLKCDYEILIDQRRYSDVIRGDE